VLTANTSTLYAFSRTDLAKDGPTVIEVPPGMLGFLDDDWQRFVGDIGVTGPDRGKGGKYLVVPPGYDGQIPQGYFLLKPRTNKNFLFLRGSIAEGLEAGAKNMTSGIRIYPLKDAAKPTPTTFINMSGKSFNTLFPNTLAYYEHLNQIIQDEPIDAIDPAQRGAIATIGIVKGKPFTPDERMKKLLTEAATLGSATARAITFEPRLDGVYLYPDTDSVWSAFFANRNATFESDGTMQLEAAVLYYFNAGGVTPAMAKTGVGVGSDYAGAYLDANKQPFDGSKTYKLHLPPNVPVNNFWAVTIYDTQTRSMLQTDQRFPTVGSQTKGIEKNADSSFDIYFSPKAPTGKEDNWLQTVPGKSWFVILRMYGPLEPWLNKTWRPSEIEFPNENNVYLHSTPAQQLFSQSRRDFSHGCVRVEKPAELAAFLLRNQPPWTLERAQAAMQSGRDNQQVNLTTPVPVLMIYVTAVVEPDNSVHFFNDIYGHDKTLNAVLAKGPPYP
jgi:hypothetical protein